jgi:hypothetical protein
MKHFYVKAIQLKAKDEDDPKVDYNLKEAAALAVDIMPYRHHRLAAIKLDKDPVIGELHENASLEELEAEMKKHWLRLAPVLDLEAMLAPPSEPSDGVANREVPQDGAAGDAGEKAASWLRSRGTKNGNFSNGNWTAEAVEERRWLRSLVKAFAP